MNDAISCVLYSMIIHFLFLASLFIPLGPGDSFHYLITSPLPLMPPHTPHSHPQHAFYTPPTLTPPHSPHHLLKSPFLSLFFPSLNVSSILKLIFTFLPPSPSYLALILSSSLSPLLVFPYSLQSFPLINLSPPPSFAFFHFSFLRQLFRFP